MLKMGGFVKKVIVENDHCCHSLDDWHRTRQDAWVVTAFGPKDGDVAISVDCVDVAQQGCHRLEGNPEIYVVAIAYTALYAT